MFSKLLHIKTEKRMEVFNLTREVNEIIKKSKVKNGLICIRTLHTTTAINVNENEPGLMKDLLLYLKKLVPEDVYYHHDDETLRQYESEDEYKRENAFSHIRSLLLGTTVTLPIIAGELTIGQWQSILFFELDGPRRDRKVEIVIMET